MIRQPGRGEDQWDQAHRTRSVLAPADLTLLRPLDCSPTAAEHPLAEDQGGGEDRIRKNPHTRSLCQSVVGKYTPAHTILARCRLAPAPAPAVAGADWWWPGIEDEIPVAHRVARRSQLGQR